MTKVKVLDVLIDQIPESEALNEVEQLIKKGGKHYIVTPNPEFIVASSKDQSFKKILNEADLSISDSPRINWAYSISSKNLLEKLMRLPLLLFPYLQGKEDIPTITGTDFMEKLIAKAQEKAFTVGLLGGRDDVAVKLSECLIEKYPHLLIQFADSNLQVDYDGEVIVDTFNNKKTLSKDIISSNNIKTGLENLQKTNLDILFVAFGHIKQEKWIDKNLNKYPVKVMMGVGGAFDYLSGEVSRAPMFVRQLGFEWLYRGVSQPWRLKRFLSLFEFINLALFTNTKA